MKSYFTSGGTEGNNLAIKGVASAYKNKGHHLITTTIEHASVRKPLNNWKRMGFEVTMIDTS